MTTEPLYPDVHVQLIGQDGNGASILGRTAQALRRGGHHAAAHEFTAQAIDGDYGDLLRLVQRYVEVS